MPRLYTLALAALLPACASTPPTPAPPDAGTTIAVEDLPRRPTAADRASIAFPSHSRVWTEPDTSVYGTVGPALNPIQTRGEVWVGMPEADVVARYGAPDADAEVDDMWSLAVGSSESVMNVVGEALRRGDPPRVRTLTWTLPNAWIREVWLVDTAEGWTVGAGIEWATDRLNF